MISSCACARPGLLDTELCGGLQALAQLAPAPLRNVPDVAARVPGTLRDLGERVAAIPGGCAAARPPSRSRLQALAASVRNDATCASATSTRSRPSTDGARADRVHPGFPEVPCQLTTDEVRIISLFQHDGPYPIVSVKPRYRHGAAIATVLRHF